MKNSSRTRGPSIGSVTQVASCSRPAGVSSYTFLFGRLSCATSWLRTSPSCSSRFRVT